MMTTSGGRDGSGETMPIHELNTKLRTIDTDAKKLKTEYEAVAKRRGREMLTEYSNEYLRMENTREHFSKPSSSSSSLVLFPTKEENKAFSRAATRKRETAVLDARTKLERDLKPTVERMRDKFVDLLERVETSIPSALPKGACFSDTFKRTQTNLLKQHVSELDAKLAILENVLEKTKEEGHLAGTTKTRGDDPTNNNNNNTNNTTSSRNVLLVAIAAWFLEPKLVEAQS